jgi:hypothetical protein
LRVLRLEVSVCDAIFTLLTSFKPLSLGAGGYLLIEVTVKSREETS